MGINASELIVGEGNVNVDGRWHTHAFAYRDGAIMDLGSLPAAGEDSGATSVNDSGEIAGWMWLSTPLGGRIHAFAYREGIITDLGTLPGDRTSMATAINGSGQIVGWSEAQTISAYYFYSVGRRRAILVEHGIMRDLAFAINSAGTIAGASTGCVDGASRATLWELPEPGVGIAFVAGAALLAGLGRRRRQSVRRASTRRPGASARRGCRTGPHRGGIVAAASPRPRRIAAPIRNAPPAEARACVQEGLGPR
jgi:uncharacterized protein (TIGR03382 family)